MKPLVSVIVATYRRDTDLWRALCSLSNQDYSNVEIVLVDDNYEPEWNKKVEILVRKFREENTSTMFQYIVNYPNQGSAKSRNIGIEAANGEYVTFLDDDDIYLPDKISRQVFFMKENQTDYSITDLWLYNEKGKLVEKRIRDYIRDTSPEALLEYHLKYHMTGTDTMMFRREYLLQIDGFPPIDVGDEFYLMHRAIDGGGKFGYLPNCDVEAVVHTGEGGLSSGQGKIDGENALYEYKKKFFVRLSKKTVRYIKVRHQAVLSYAYLRKRMYFKAGGKAIIAFLISPICCLEILRERK